MSKKISEKYVLKNKTKRDINLGDLRYKIPAGKAKDLLSPRSRLSRENVIESASSGSIHKYLKRGFLIEVIKIVEAPTPKIGVSEPTAIIFPQRLKSSITIKVTDITEEIRELTISEDDELLKQLEADGDLFDGEAPIVAKDKKEEKK